MSRSTFAVPDMGVALKIVDAAPAAGMFGKPQHAASGPCIVLDHDEAYQEKAESLVRSFVPTARRVPAPGVTT
jgi:hypothetical protein